MTSDATLLTFKRLTKIIDRLKSIELLGMQVPHHGSKENFSFDFWSALKRCGNCKAVISVGENNYDHPSPCVIKKLTKLKFKILQTNNNYPNEKVRLANQMFDDDSELIDPGDNDETIEIPIETLYSAYIIIACELHTDSDIGKKAQHINTNQEYRGNKKVINFSVDNPFIFRLR